MRAEFALARAQVPWRSMRGMRNRIADGHFDINLDVVRETVRTAVPALLRQLPAVRRRSYFAGRSRSSLPSGLSVSK